MLRTGVWFSDVPGHPSEGAHGGTLLEVTVADVAAAGRQKGDPRGNRSVKVVPSDSVEVTSTTPSCAVATFSNNEET